MDILSRCIKQTPERTVSSVWIYGYRVCYVVEDIVRDKDTDNDGDIDAEDVAAFKVSGKTAIPAGRYRVTLEQSPKYGPNTITLNDVPGFTFIRCHAGNDENDTEGCQIPGLKITPEGKIEPGTTKPAVAMLQRFVKDAIEAGEQVWWQIDRSLVGGWGERS